MSAQQRDGMIVVRESDPGTLVVERVANAPRSARQMPPSHELYDRYGAAAYALAVRMVGPGRDAEDAIADSFTRAVRPSAFATGSDRSQAGILQAVRRRCLETLSARRGEPEAGRSFAVATPLGRSVRHSREQVCAALDRMPEELRTTIELAYFEGCTPAELAMRTGVSLLMVNDRLRVGLRQLHALLGDAI